MCMALFTSQGDEWRGSGLEPRPRGISPRPRGSSPRPWSQSAGTKPGPGVIRGRESFGGQGGVRLEPSWSLEAGRGRDEAQDWDGGWNRARKRSLELAPRAAVKDVAEGEQGVRSFCGVGSRALPWSRELSASVEQGTDPRVSWEQLGASARRRSRSRGCKESVAGSRAVEDDRRPEQGSAGMETGEVRARTKAGEPGRNQKHQALFLDPARCSGLLASDEKRPKAKADGKRPRAEADGPSNLPEAALVHRGCHERSGDGAGAGSSTNAGTGDSRGWEQSGRGRPGLGGSTDSAPVLGRSKERERKGERGRAAGSWPQSLQEEDQRQVS